jgi:hypothetical protein
MFIKTLQFIFYKTHYMFEKYIKVLKTRDNLKDIKLAQTKSQKLSISTTDYL